MKKILIIEDDVDLLALAEMILQDAGYAVITVNRQISIKEIAGINPNLVIIDYLLSFGLGTELCLQLKTDQTTDHIPIILFSAINDLERLAHSCKADGHIAKPFNLDDFVGLVNRLVL